MIELVERVKLVRCALEPQNKIISKQLHDVFIERLGLVVVGAVGLDQDELKTVICTVFGVVDEVFEEVIHIRLENVSKVDGIIYLCKD